MNKEWMRISALVAIGVALDQVTKQLADHFIKPIGQKIIIDGFFQLRYSRNPGAFFSIGGDLPDSFRRGFFIVATLLAIGLIVQLYRKAEEHQRSLKVAMVLLLGGAFGNLVDRVLYGSVIDFLHLHVRDVFHWATFNVADIYITFGLVLLIWDMFTSGRSASDHDAGAKASSGEAAS